MTGWVPRGFTPDGFPVWSRPVDLVDVQAAREAAVTRSLGTVVGPDWEAILPDPTPPQYPRIMLHRPGYRPREMRIDKVETTDDGWTLTMRDPRWTIYGEGKCDD